MIAVEIIGGLGNQMFQYATAKAMALHRRDDLLIDKRPFESYSLHSFSLPHFNVTAPYLKEEIVLDLKSTSDKLKAFIKGQKNYTLYQENGLGYDASLFDIPAKNVYLKGYFQSEKYFIKYEDEIRNDFEIVTPLQEKTVEMLTIIHEVNSVSLHIRRGDYVTNPEANSVHGTCNLDYYQRAISHIREVVENPIFFIFSDDIQWAKENLTIPETTHFIDFTDASTNYEDIKLMSTCKHNIIANSSFSWWGAWLNKNKSKIVIAPSKWFNVDYHNADDIIPESWMKI